MSLCVHQGPAGIRGARGEKVNMTSPFSICVIMRAASPERSARVK